MSRDNKLEKDKVRNEILKKRNQLDLDFIEESSDLIIEKLKVIINKNNFKNIMIFMDMKNEVKITKLLMEFGEERNFYIPKIMEKGIMRINKYEKR